MSAGQPQHDPWVAGRLTSAQLDAVLSGLDGLAVLPSAARAVQAAIAPAPDSPRLAPQLLDVIRCDPALTARVLSLAASCPAPAMTAAAAAGQLDPDVVRVELLALPAAQDDSDAEHETISLRALYLHSLAVALAAEGIAAHLDAALDPQEAFTCGLLHDLGKLALATALPKSFRRAAELAAASHGDISELERHVIGADHATIGRRLAETWRLPHLVAEVAWLHHQPPQAMPPAATDTTMIALVALADAVARQLQLGFSGNYVFRPSVQDRARALGLAESALEDLSRRLPQAVQEASRLVASAESSGPPHQSLRQLVARLATTNRQLHAQASAASTQAQALRELGEFAATLSGQSSIRQALERIAKLIAGALGLVPSASLPTVVYSIDPAGQGVQVLRDEGGGRLSSRTLAAGNCPPAPPAGDAREVLAALLADPQELADWVDPAACRHLPLIGAGHWVGGALLPSAPGATPAPEPVVTTVTSAAAMALAIVQGRCRAALLSEQLAGASQVLAASQEALAEAKLLAAIGELAAGAAHELNNPLAVISGRAQLMRDKVGKAEERRTWDLISDQAQRISDTLTSLMEIASPPPPQPGRVDPVELLKSAAEAFSSSGHPQASSAQVDIEVREGTPAAWADAAQIRGVIVEAITNAATAADGRAHVCLAARGSDDGQGVLFTVSDDGPGMDAATLERAFTPFFSLQRAGRRQGLGLPKARRYVETNAGKIWITSQVARGTQLHVQLPHA